MRTQNRAKKFILGAALALACMHAYIATANQTGQAAIDARQENLKALGGAFKAVRDETRKSQPDMTQVKQATAKIEKLAADMKGWFPQGSGPSKEVETDAKAEIWSDAQGFAAVLANFQKEAPKLNALAQANDLSGLKQQIGPLGGACKGCHDKYRVPQD